MEIWSVVLAITNADQHVDAWLLCDGDEDQPFASCSIPIVMTVSVLPSSMLNYIPSSMPCKPRPGRRACTHPTRITQPTRCSRRRPRNTSAPSRRTPERAIKPSQRWGGGGDTEATTCAAHQTNHIPGAIVSASDASSKGMHCQAADGSPSPNRGGCDVPIKFEAGARRGAMLRDASVMCPIISLRCVADANHAATITKACGMTNASETGKSRI